MTADMSEEGDVAIIDKD